MPTISNLVVPTQHHPLTMPIHVVPNALTNPPMHKPDIILDDVAVAYVPTANKQAAVDDHKIKQNRKRGTYIEMTTMPQPP